MNICHKWMGAFGAYDVPPAIVWLANKANEAAGIKGARIAWQSADEFKTFYRSPGWRVIEEWGTWRDAEAEKAWKSQ